MACIVQNNPFSSYFNIPSIFNVHYNQVWVLSGMIFGK